MVSQDKWSLVTALVVFTCRSLHHNIVVFQERWSLTAVHSQTGFNETTFEQPFNAQFATPEQDKSSNYKWS